MERKYEDFTTNGGVKAPSLAVREGGGIRGNLGRFSPEIASAKPIEHFSRNARDY